MICFACLSMLNLNIGLTTCYQWYRDGFQSDCVGAVKLISPQSYPRRPEPSVFVQYCKTTLVSSLGIAALRAPSLQAFHLPFSVSYRCISPRRNVVVRLSTRNSIPACYKISRGRIQRSDQHISTCPLQLVEPTSEVPSRLVSSSVCS